MFADFGEARSVYLLRKKKRERWLSSSSYVCWLNCTRIRSYSCGREVDQMQYEGFPPKTLVAYRRSSLDL